MKIIKIVFVVLLVLTGCSKGILTPEKGFEKLMIQAKKASQEGDYAYFQSLYTQTSDEAVIKQDYALDYSAFDDYDKKRVSVIEQLEDNYLFACSHYSVKDGDVDEIYFTAVIQKDGNNWRFNYDPLILQRINAMLIQDAYPEEMFQTENAVTFDAPFLFLDENAVYEDCVHTALLNLWDNGQMYCQIWVANGLDKDIQLNSFSIQAMDTKFGLIADDEIEIKESLKAGKSKIWILPVQALQQTQWSDIGVDYVLDWDEMVLPAR